MSSEAINFPWKRKEVYWNEFCFLNKMSYTFCKVVCYSILIIFLSRLIFLLFLFLSNEKIHWHKKKVLVSRIFIWSLFSAFLLLSSFFIHFKKKYSSIYFMNMKKWDSIKGDKNIPSLLFFILVLFNIRYYILIKICCRQPTTWIMAFWVLFTPISQNENCYSEEFEYKNFP